MYISINSTFKHILSNYLILFDKYKSMYKSRIEIVDFLYKKKKKETLNIWRVTVKGVFVHSSAGHV